MWPEIQQRLLASAFAHQLDDLLLAPVQHFFEQLADAAPALATALVELAGDPRGVSRWRALVASNFLRDAIRNEPDFALALLQQDLAAPPPSLTTLTERHGAVAGLRRHRRCAMLAIGWRDLAGEADLDATLAALSTLADDCIGFALARARADMRARYGQLYCEDGTVNHLYAICMGKLGGRELNFSSDIDLIFCHTAAGASDGPKVLQASEYCLREARRAIDLLDTRSADGRVFRVDTRLRPFGDSGPLVVSLAALENYLLEHGRDWERYAFVKARFIGSDGNDAADAAVAAFSETVLRPFVYRRYLDFGVLASLRDMQQMIAREVERRDLRDHLKLGPGGIREIEFIAQSWQLIRGGQQRRLRTRSLQRALRAAATFGCVPEPDAVRLTAAYRYLRIAENRLQALDDQQTHSLPTDDATRRRLVLAMQARDWQSFRAELGTHREHVTDVFARLVFAAGDEAGADGAPGRWLDSDGAARRRLLETHGVGDAEAIEAVFASYIERWRAQPLENIASERLNRFVDCTARMLAGTPNAAVALPRLLDVASAVLRRSAYLSFLIEQPAALQRLLHLCGVSQYLADQLSRRPMLLDELLDERIAAAPLSAGELKRELARTLDAGDSDSESRMQALVRFTQATWFRIAVADCSGALPLMRVSDHLCELAELVLATTLATAWSDLCQRHGAPAGATADAMRFAIVGYGKLGGLELGYDSDLDIVFLHDFPSASTSGAQAIDNTLFATRLARRVIHLLSAQTSDGMLYEIDTRLRPSGRSGYLVSSLAAFARYQAEDAWTWEHQALTRARPVAGDARLAREFATVREQTLREHVRHDTLLQEVADMRRKMRAATPGRRDGMVHLKSGPGGITDLEFIVQYLLLAHAQERPALLQWSDNIRQLDSLAAAGMIGADEAAALQDAYRALRVRIHRLALDRRDAWVADDQLLAARTVVTDAWQRCFGAA